MELKLSNIWTNFNYFMNLCLLSGTNDTKYRMKIIKTFFNDNNEFDGNWQNLYNDILYIFCFDKRIAGKMSYTKPFLLQQQDLLHERNGIANSVRSGLFDKLKLTYRVINENGDIQFWNSSNDYYKISDFIYLTKTIETKQEKVEIIGSSLRQEKDYFLIKNGENNKILIEYKNNIYVSSINVLTNKRVQISKYPEIIHFINAKYYGILLDNLSYNSFKYLVTSFCEIKNLTVPTNKNGYLGDVVSASYLSGIFNIKEYFESADKRYENIQFTYGMNSYNKFFIKRKSDDALINSIMEIENDWAERKRAQPLSPRATSKLDTNLTKN